jgi:hypothetical protein
MREREMYIEFVTWLLHLSEELPCPGDLIINGKCSIKNRGLGVRWRMRFNHVVNQGSWEQLETFQTRGFLEKNMSPVPELRSQTLS